MGGYERDSQPAFLPDGTGRPRRDPARLQRPAARGRLGPLRRDHRELEDAGCPVMDEVKITKLINGPEAFTPDNEFCLGESEVARLVRRRGLLRPRARRRRRDRQGDGRVDRRGRAEPRPVGDGRAPVRRAVPLARLHPRADPRDLRDLLRHPLPQPRASGRAAAAASPPPTPGTPSTARRSARSRAGSGSTGTSRTPPPATSRCARAAGPASHWSPAIGAEHRATREARGALRRDARSRRWRSPGPAPPSCSSASATTGSRASVGQDHLHPDAQHAAAGSSATSPSPGSPRSCFSIVTGTAFGNHDREWIRKHLPGDGSGPGRAT